ncbi:hypothetical protein K501DRAFT_271905 [Backusella circina FSU 941]|nr:hypothetical protein K501DRAFT_271905 [Backusella circina FSU 941]
MNPDEQQYVPPPSKMTQLNSRKIATYRLNIVQHPIRARCCGFGEKDRRSLDPPPVIKLIAEDANGDEIYLNPTDTILLVLQCELFSHDKETNQTLVYAPWTMQSFSESGPTERKPEHIRNLIGATVSSVYHLNDENNVPGTFFIFHDLSIRTEGIFTLKFTFIDIGNWLLYNKKSLFIHSKYYGTSFSNTESEAFTRPTGHEEIFTDPFSVYSAKKFPGLTESTPLSRCFSKQGIKIPIRNDTFRRTTVPTASTNNPIISSTSTAIAVGLSPKSSSSSSTSSPSFNIVTAATATMEHITLEGETNTAVSITPPERANNYTRLPISDFLVPEQ